MKKSFLFILAFLIFACDNNPQEKPSVAKFKLAANLAAEKDNVVYPYYKVIADAFTLVANGADKATIVAKLREDKSGSKLVASLITAFEQNTKTSFKALAEDLRTSNNEFSRVSADAFDARADELK